MLKLNYHGSFQSYIEMAPSEQKTEVKILPVEPGSQVSKVVVHPLVLLSVVDHYNRVSKIGAVKRVVGVLLGSWQTKDVLDISNSFAGRFHSESSFATLAYLLQVGFQSHLMKTTRTPTSGFWIMTIWLPCTLCSRRSTVT